MCVVAQHARTARRRSHVMLRRWLRVACRVVCLRGAENDAHENDGPIAGHENAEHETARNKSRSEAANVLVSLI